MRAILLCDSDAWARVYGARQRERLRALLGHDPRVMTLRDLRAAGAADAELIFSTWGMPRIDSDEIARLLPNLRALFYAAGSVQRFARPFLARGVRVFSAWQANAVPVAQFALAQMLLASKGYFRAQTALRTSRAEAARIATQYPGMYDIDIGLIGCGAIGRLLAQSLRAYDCNVWVHDPFVSDDALAALGARRASMDALFMQCDIVSNHLPDLPATKGAIKRAHLFSMRENATLINTGRGAQLCERDLYDLLTARRDVTALLDVLTDEANSDENPLIALPNCFVTPHIAGSSGNEVMRMADHMIDECARYLKGEPARYEVTDDMLETMA
ncbi:MAG: hydroxyacid dehydrogenase [Christensenellales bacterium]|jgi:phosphoglycerate dehydrogenase-like enzyme